MSKSQELVRSDNIGTESLLSKNDGVQNARVVVVVDVGLLKEQNHNNKVHDDKENVPITNSTELHGTEEVH